MNTYQYVYVIEDLPNVCKIGYSKYFPEIRQQEISIKYHRNFILKGMIVGQDAYEDEKLIHNYLNEFRINGEWFRLSYKEIKEKLEKLNFYFMDIEIFKFIHKAKWIVINDSRITREEFFTEKELKFIDAN